MDHHPVNYNALAVELQALVENVPYEIADLANAAALLWLTLPDINWAGFYRLESDGLILGPFQGKPACIQIPLGSGVCGTAAAEDKVFAVPDVHVFPGHIACDSASRSEIVLPIHKKDGQLYGVLDIDSPITGRFSEADQKGLGLFVNILEKALFAY